MMTHHSAISSINPLNLLVLAVIYALISITVFRLAVRVVAGDYPEVWNVLYSSYLAGAVFIAVHAFSVYVLGTFVSGLTLAAISWALSYIMLLLALNALVHLPNGEQIGVFKIFLARIVSIIFLGILGAIVGVSAIAIFGKQALHGLDKYKAAYLADVEKNTGLKPSDFPTANFNFWIHLNSAAPGAAGAPTPIGPAPGTHAILKTAIQLEVPYGEITVPAGSPVTIIEIQGDSCRVLSAGNTFSVSQRDLAIPQ